jgi:hypothetical protein
MRGFFIHSNGIYRYHGVCAIPNKRGQACRSALIGIKIPRYHKDIAVYAENLLIKRRNSGKRLAKPAAE